MVGKSQREEREPFNLHGKLSRVNIISRGVAGYGKRVFPQPYPHLRSFLIFHTIIERILLV